MLPDKLRILIVDDDLSIRRFLQTVLSAEGYAPVVVSNGSLALQQARLEHPDLVILDLGLPDIDGEEVTRQLREWSQVPIIILSVRDQQKDKIAALDAGADDYLTKPFGSGELLARIRVALRHARHPQSSPVYDFNNLHIDIPGRIVTLNKDEIALTPTEFDLLHLMAVNAGRVLTHRYLLRQVWGEAYELETHLLRVNISNLRRKIESDPAQPRFILTEPGVGYRMRLET
jgi:two-component system, OmpR family, KDP operon response regulator KdpE